MENNFQVIENEKLKEEQAKIEEAEARALIWADRKALGLHERFTFPPSELHLDKAAEHCARCGDKSGGQLDYWLQYKDGTTLLGVLCPSCFQESKSLIGQDFVDFMERLLKERAEKDL